MADDQIDQTEADLALPSISDHAHMIGGNTAISATGCRERAYAAIFRVR